MSAEPTSPLQYLPIYKSALLDDVIPFWLKHGIDREVLALFAVLLLMLIKPAIVVPSN